MRKKEILCESCEAVFRIQHDMEEHYYSISHCPFCGDELNSSEDNEDELYDDEDYN